MMERANVSGEAKPMIGRENGFAIIYRLWSEDVRVSVVLKAINDVRVFRVP